MNSQEKHRANSSAYPSQRNIAGIATSTTIVAILVTACFGLALVTSHSQAGPVPAPVLSSGTSGVIMLDVDGQFDFAITGLTAGKFFHADAVIGWATDGEDVFFTGIVQTGDPSVFVYMTDERAGTLKVNVDGTAEWCDNRSDGATDKQTGEAIFY